MKILSIIGHPALVMSLFLLVMISGQHIGGFYLLYIIMGLYIGAYHSILAILGMSMIFVGYKMFRKKLSILKPALYLFGIAILILSFISFFENSNGYNQSTFVHTVPLITLFLFGISALFCTVYSIILMVKILKSREDTIGVVSR